mgnify:CR=1 FL=1
MKVGKLGTFLFPAGKYVYTGSALNGLENRLARHLRKEKRLRWHIDYLLQHAQVEGILVVETDERLECELNRWVLSSPNARVIVKGFGSSDCRCPAHLVYLGGNLTAHQEMCSQTGKFVFPHDRNFFGASGGAPSRKADFPSPNLSSSHFLVASGLVPDEHLNDSHPHKCHFAPRTNFGVGRLLSRTAEFSAHARP